jgi:hypothetical protein
MIQVPITLSSSLEYCQLSLEHPTANWLLINDPREKVKDAFLS